MAAYKNEKSFVTTFVRHLRSRQSLWGEVHVSREFDYQRGRTDVLVLSNQDHVIAFEAKLTKWREALHQAYRNTCFAHKSYVLLPLEVALKAQRFSEEFDRRRVGLCYLDRGQVAVLREAADQIPLQPWLSEVAMMQAKGGHGRRSRTNCSRTLPDAGDAVHPQSR
jgi:hypothetical protein